MGADDGGMEDDIYAKELEKLVKAQAMEKRIRNVLISTLVVAAVGVSSWYFPQHAYNQKLDKEKVVAATSIAKEQKTHDGVLSEYLATVAKTNSLQPKIRSFLNEAGYLEKEAAQKDAYTDSASVLQKTYGEEIFKTDSTIANYTISIKDKEQKKAQLIKEGESLDLKIEEAKKASSQLDANIDALKAKKNTILKYYGKPEVK